MSATLSREQETEIIALHFGQCDICSARHDATTLHVHRMPEARAYSIVCATCYSAVNDYQNDLRSVRAFVRHFRARNLLDAALRFLSLNSK